MPNKPDPKDKDYLRQIGKEVDKRLPDNYGFILLALPIGESPNNRLAYIASVKREDAIAAMKEFLIKCGAEEDWMKHIS